MFPSVLLTLLSIIQALALELLWGHLVDRPHLRVLSWSSILEWTQIATMFLGILQIWLFYASLVMRFRWLPSQRDSILPFVIGILEFTLIELLGPGSFGPWFFTLALIFAVSIRESLGVFRRARQDPTNSEFFESMEPTTFRDLVHAIGTVGGLALIGLVLQLSGNQGWPALVGLLLAGAALAYQIVLSQRYWNIAMEGGEHGQDAVPEAGQ